MPRDINKFKLVILNYFFYLSIVTLQVGIPYYFDEPVTSPSIMCFSHHHPSKLNEEGKLMKA